MVIPKAKYYFIFLSVLLLAHQPTSAVIGQSENEKAINSLDMTEHLKISFIERGDVTAVDKDQVIWISDPQGQSREYYMQNNLRAIVRAQGGPDTFEAHLLIAGVVDKEVVFKKRNLLSPRYQATKQSVSGKESLALPNTHNYIVYDRKDGGHLGRINFDETSLTGMLFLPEGTFTISKKIADSHDLLDGALCNDPIHRALKPAPLSTSGKRTQSKSALGPCFVIEVATESDYELYQKYGSSGLQTIEHVIDQFNLVEGIYLNSGIDLSFALVYQNVWTTSSDPYLATTRFDMRDEFKAIWNNVTYGFTDIDRDVAYMVSGKINTNGGAAFTSTAGDLELAYAVGQEFDSDTDQHLIAHEIGHTLSASHDTGSDCTDDKPTSGTMCPFVGTQGFSANSVSEISTYVNDNSGSFTHLADIIVFGLFPITGFSNYIATAMMSLNIEISSTGYVQAVAGERITLPVEFHARSGSHFRATINEQLDSCN